MSLSLEFLLSSRFSMYGKIEYMNYSLDLRKYKSTIPNKLLKKLEAFEFSNMLEIVSTTPTSEAETLEITRM